jgi:SH3-like domain-containing protein
VRQTKSSLVCELGLVLLGLFFAIQVHALEFRSVAVNKAILYDAPSIEAKKLYLIGSGYPVEVIVNLGEWIKVRDHFGSLSWVQAKQLTNKRTALIIADKIELKQAEEETSALVATFEKDVVVEVISTTAKNGWVKVKHRDGLSGFVRSTVLWGL